MVPREGFALDLIRSGGLKGKSLAGAGCAGSRCCRSALSTPGAIVSRRRPDLVIGVGGYSSGPVVLVAALRGVPTMLLEQNAVPGLTNRLLAPRRARGGGDVRLDAWRSFGAKAFVSGNPVRPEFFARPDRSDGGVDDAAAARVLVFGGSQGAHAINVAMVEAAPALAAAGRSLRSRTRRESAMWRWSATAYRRAGLDGRRRAVPLRHGRRDAAAPTWSSAARARRRWRS